MKKIKLLGFICAVFTVITFWACSKDSESYQPDEFLQFSGNVNFSQLNNAESVILQKAQKRIDKHIRLSNGQFSMDIQSGKEAGMSEEIFNFFSNCMKSSNENIRKAQSAGFAVIQTGSKSLQIINPDKQIPFALTKTDTEIPEGGITGVQSFWWGSKTYFSNADLKEAADILNTGGDLSTLLGGFGFIPAAVTSCLLNWQAREYAKAAENNPNGIVISEVAGVIKIGESGQNPGDIVDLDDWVL